MGKSNIQDRMNGLRKHAQEAGLTVEFSVSYETGRQQILLKSIDVFETFEWNTKGFRAANARIRAIKANQAAEQERKGQLTTEYGAMSSGYEKGDPAAR